ncbi:MAG: histidine kinase N-terminal 7TM domain-containing protein [Candidatus Bathyarchaeia archaeon]
MEQQFFILVGISIISIITAFFTYRRNTPKDKASALVILASVLWILSVGLEIASASYSLKVFSNKIQFICMIVVPTIWFIYALQYVDHKEWITRRNLAILSIMPVICILLIFTNELHNQVYDNISMNASNPYLPLDIRYGFLFWVFLWYTYTLLIFASLLSIQMLIRSRRLYRRQITALLITTAIPWISSAIFCFEIRSLPFNLTPLSYAIVGVILVLVNPTRLYLQDIMPIARDIVIDSMSDCVIVVDEQNRVLDLNSAACKIVNSKLDEVIGMKADLIFSFLHILKDEYQQLIDATKEVTINDKTFDTRVSSLRDWRGRLNCRVIVMRDITEKKMIEEELRHYSERLEDLVEERTRELKLYSEELEQIVKERTKELREAERLAAIGELASMVGHDLRNPLMGIAGATFYIKNTLGKSAEGKIKEMLETIEYDIARSNKIINDLLDYSKELKLELKLTSIKQVINETMKAVELPKNIEVMNEIYDKSEIPIDSEKMKRVFINIIKNSIEAMPNGGKIIIKSYEKSDILKIEISDTGKGIPGEIMKNLWKPLVTTKAKGMGFGLAICKRIVEAHKGTIFLESIVGKGTSVTIILPKTLNKKYWKEPLLINENS